MKTLDPDPEPESLEMLDLDPDEQHWESVINHLQFYSKLQVIATEQCYIVA